MSLFFLVMKTAEATWKIKVAINLIPASTPERPHRLGSIYHGLERRRRDVLNRTNTQHELHSKTISLRHPWTAIQKRQRRSNGFLSNELAKAWIYNSRRREKKRNKKNISKIWNDLYSNNIFQLLYKVFNINHSSFIFLLYF